jgi:hypothetical protein
MNPLRRLNTQCSERSRNKFPYWLNRTAQFSEFLDPHNLRTAVITLFEATDRLDMKGASLTRFAWLSLQRYHGAEARNGQHVLLKEGEIYPSGLAKAKARIIC